jgi:hypothetical protein
MRLGGERTVEGGRVTLPLDWLLVMSLITIALCAGLLALAPRR